MTGYTALSVAVDGNTRSDSVFGSNIPCAMKIGTIPLDCVWR